MNSLHKVGGIRVIPNTDGSQTNSVDLADRSNAGSIKLRAPDGVPTDVALTLPPGLAKPGQALFDPTGSGVLAWGGAISGTGSGLGTQNLYIQIPNGVKNGSNVNFYLDYIPASAPTGTPAMIPVWLFVNGNFQSPYVPRYSLVPGSNNIVMIVPPKATDEFIVLYEPGASAALLPPVTIPPPGGTGFTPVTTPVIRGSAAASGTSSSFTLSLTSLDVPGGGTASAVAGDFALLFWSGFNAVPTLPSGWTLLYSHSGGIDWNTFAASKVLVSGDISTGSVSVASSGSFPGMTAITVFQGATGGVRETHGNQNHSAIGGSAPWIPDVKDTLTTSSSVISTDAGVYFGSAWYGAAMTAAVSPGTTIQSANLVTSGAAAAGVLAIQSMPGGVESITFEYSTANNGFADSIVIVEGVPSAAFVSFSQPSGTVLPDALQTITLYAPTGYAIFYTTDGSTPTTSSTLYSGPIPVPVGLTIKAIAVSPSGAVSGVSSASYTIGAPSIPVVAGKALIAWVTNPSTNSYTNAPSGGDISFMTSHIDRILFYTPYGDSRLSWFPNGWVYRDSSSIYNPANTALVTSNPTWVLRDASGNPCFIPFGYAAGVYPQYLPDYGNTGFRAWWIAAATANLSAGYVGLFVDDVNMDIAAGSGGADIIPIDPRTGIAMTQANWETYMVGFVEAVRAAFPTKEIVHNAVWTAAGGNPSTDALLTRQINACDWVYLERGFNDPGITGGTGQFALRTMFGFIDKVHGLARHFVAGQYSVNTTDYFPLACYFAVTNGGDLFVPDAQTTTPPQWPVIDYVDLGAALGPRYDWVAGSGGTLQAATVPQIVSDMTGLNDAHPHGVPSGYDFYSGPFIGMGNNPAGNGALEWWADLYVGPSGNPATNTFVNVKLCTLYWMRASTGAWTTIDLAASDFGGGYYTEDFVTDLMTAVTIRTETDGSFSYGTTIGDVGHIYAPFPRIAIDPSDMGGIVVVCEARLILNNPLGTDDRTIAALLFGVGADYYPATTGPGISNNPGVGGGKFKYVTETWQPFCMTTLSLAQLNANPPPGGGGGIIRRDFVNGSVFVAEPGGGGTAPLGAAYIDPLGNSVTSVSLTGGQGMILQASVTHSAPSTADVVFPSGSGIVDVTAHGATGNGSTDDTAAIQSAMNYAWTNGLNVVYFPSGTYLISDTLIWKDTGGTWRAFLAFWGQNQATTTIKLKNSCTGFSTATGSPMYAGSAISAKAMIFTASNLETNVLGAGESAYYTDIHDLTLDCGTGNPGAQAIDWQASNCASIRNVTIAGAGRVGINTSRGFGGSGNGPALIKNVTVSGTFDYPFISGSGEVGVTWEHLFITSSPNVTGFWNADQNTWIRDLNMVVSGTAQGVVNSGNGNMTIIDSTFTGSGATAAAAGAINNSAWLFARNVSTTGFLTAIAGVAGRNASEYSSLGTEELFTPFAATTINLTINETPDFLHDNNFSADWAVVTAGGGDRTTDIQTALNSGKPVVFFQAGAYTISNNLTVPSSVQRILGLFSQLNTTGTYTITFNGTTGPCVYMSSMAFSGNISAVNNATIPVVIIDVFNLNGYANAAKTGYIENGAINGPVTLSGGNVWARQLDIETENTHWQNTGGNLWVMGYKTEGTGNQGAGLGLGSTTGGSSSEILGAFDSTPGAAASPGYYGYFTTDSSCCIVGLSSGSFRTVILTETRSGVTHTYSNIANRYGGTAVTFYSGRL